MSQLNWQISTGYVFELLRPVSFVLAVFVSTGVFVSARRQGFRFYSVVGWALSTFFFPLIFLPLYFIARLITRARMPAANPSNTRHTSMVVESASLDDEQAAFAHAQPEPAGATADAGVEAQHRSSPKPSRRRALLPAFYAFTLLATGALYFYLDRQSVDAHLARAADARLRSHHERAIIEYRAALLLEENPHTRKLLGLELEAAKRHAEALAEFQRAAQAGEPDDKLYFYLANTLHALNQPAAAAIEFQKFLASEYCQTTPAPTLCQIANTRLHERPR